MGVILRVSAGLRRTTSRIQMAVSQLTLDWVVAPLKASKCSNFTIVLPCSTIVLLSVNESLFKP